MTWDGLTMLVKCQFEWKEMPHLGIKNATTSPPFCSAYNTISTSEKLLYDPSVSSNYDHHIPSRQQRRFTPTNMVVLCTYPSHILFCPPLPHLTLAVPQILASPDLDFLRDEPLAPEHRWSEYKAKN